MATLTAPTRSLSILSLAEPIIAASNANLTATEAQTAQRNSNVSASTENDDSASPASLETDLGHYKELFSKLRLTYLEQSSKERFLRSLLSNPPLIVSGTENNALEAELANQKAELQRRKEEVSLLVEHMGKRGRELAGRSEALKGQRELVESLPAEIEGLEREVGELRRRESEREGGGGMGVGEMREAIGKREEELECAEQRIEELEGAVDGMDGEAEQLERAVGELQSRKGDVLREVREIEKGGKGVDRERMGLEERGRWEKGKEGLLRGLLGMEA